MGKLVQQGELPFNNNTISITQKGLFLLKVMEGESVSNFKIMVY
jgi:hypothetical protein